MVIYEYIIPISLFEQNSLFKLDKAQFKFEDLMFGFDSVSFYCNDHFKL